MRQPLGVSTIHFFKLNFKNAFLITFYIPLGMYALVATPNWADAHGFAGERFFPATISTDDPFVADELSLPTFQAIRQPGAPPAKTFDFSADIALKLTPNFGIEIADGYLLQKSSGSRLQTGFHNVEVGGKYQLLVSAEHETIVSVGVNAEIGGTGRASIGTDRFSTITPGLFFGKGLGDLPDTLSWIRPVAITGQIGYAIPGRSSTTTFGIDPDTGDPTIDTEFHPRVLNWGGTIQYSMPYLKSAVIDLGLPDFINRLIPLVEATLQTPVSNTLTSGTVTTGTINPGFIWVGNTFQIGLEAQIPINRQSGTNVGVIGQLHFYLDDIDPRGIGKPIFGNAVGPATPFGRN